MNALQSFFFFFSRIEKGIYINGSASILFYYYLVLLFYLLLSRSLPCNFFFLLSSHQITFTGRFTWHHAGSYIILEEEEV